MTASRNEPKSSAFERVAATAIQFVILGVALVTAAIAQILEGIGSVRFWTMVWAVPSVILECTAAYLWWQAPPRSGGVGNEWWRGLILSVPALLALLVLWAVMWLTFKTSVLDW